jgi:hypothetical protein
MFMKNKNGFGKLNIAKDENGRSLNAQVIKPVTFDGMIDDMKEDDGLGKIMSKKQQAVSLIDKIKKKRL